jgi:beta-RFAP synthase
VKVTIKTPARLHLGLVDMNGDLGRLFGGLGVGIDHPNVIVEAQTAADLKISGQAVQKTAEITDRFFAAYKVPKKVHLNVVEAIPCHVGLGSGTQLSIAVAVALARVLNVNASVPELATSVGRAKRTSVGTSIFQYGGFVVDGGKNMKTQAVPPLIYRQPFPKEWRFIVAIPTQPKGLSNSEENHAFDKLSTQPAQDVGQISRLIMYKLLPSLAEHDIEAFGDALTKIQVIIGNQFAQAQGGTYSSPACADCIEFMKQNGAHGVGQSSWGPALYAVVKQEDAKMVLAKVKAYLRGGVGGEAFIAKANNKGASLKVEA